MVETDQGSKEEELVEWSKLRKGKEQKERKGDPSMNDLPH